MKTEVKKIKGFDFRGTVPGGKSEISLIYYNSSNNRNVLRAHLRISMRLQ